MNENGMTTTSNFICDSDVKAEVLKVFNHYKDIRDMFTLTLDSIMEKLHIDEDMNCNKTRNIFDELATKIENKMEK